MQFTPYLNFDGNCAEAFAFYAKLFGGTIVHQSTFGEIPPSENMPPLPEAAKSRIMDADFAAETAALTRAQILQQAGTAMLSQANSLPQQVLSLLQ